GPAPRAGLAGHLGRHLDLGGAAGIGLLDGDLHVVAEISAALATGALAAASPAAHEVAENVVEDVGHRGAEVARKSGAGAAILEGGVAVTVVGGPLLRVAQALISGAD